MADARPALSRVGRRQQRNRDALIEAAYAVVSTKGSDAATISEIAQIADVASGTAYSYFASKDELVISMMERVMFRLAERIASVTVKFTDPGEAYALGVRSVLCSLIEDPRWRGLLNRSEMMADVMYRVMGPYARGDLDAGRQAGRYAFGSIDVVWRTTTHALVGFGLAVSREQLPPTALADAMIAILGMAGMPASECATLAARTWPELPRE